MKRDFGRIPGTKKADGVADAINRLLHALVRRCTKGEDILDRCYLGVIGYGSRIRSALGGALAGQSLVPVSAIGKNPLRVESRTKKDPDGAGGVIEMNVSFPVWIEPVASGKTHMHEALTEAHKTLKNFVDNRRRAFPPIVINITDGMASDAEPEKAAADLRALQTEYGNVLLFNVHISDKVASPIELPVDESQLPDKYARRLFQMSSELPPEMIAEARSMEFDVSDGARGFVFNGDLVSVIRFLEFGTRTSP